MRKTLCKEEFTICEIVIENQRLESNWNELKEWLKEQDIFITELPAYTKEIGIEHKIMSNCYEATIDKMEEIESRNNEEKNR